MEPRTFRQILAVAFAIGVITGLFGGLVGLGGGALMVPLLAGWARLTRHEAHATSLAGVVVAGMSGAFTYARAGAVDWTGALLLGGIAIVATYAAAHYSALVRAARLRSLFGVFLLIAAVMLVVKDHILTLNAPVGDLRIVFLLGCGVFIGVTSGLLGVGGGALMVPLLVIALNMPQHLAQGTSLAAMVPAALSGTVAHARNRTVRFDVIVGLVPGLAAGTVLGSRLALVLPGGTLRIFLAVVLLLIGMHHLRRERAAPAP